MIEQLAFGSTGHVSTRTLFGAAALGEASQDEADRALELLLEHGVNHVDTAASYGDSELRIGPWMREHRSDFFLATKTGEREYGPAREQIRRSLELLQTDRVDLLQLHNLVDKGEWETALGPGGALEAAVEARDEGLVRFIGVTGHGLDVAQRHSESLTGPVYNRGSWSLQKPLTVKNGNVFQFTSCNGTAPNNLTVTPNPVEAPDDVTRTVAVWRNAWLAGSETFVRDQIAALRSWTPLRFGLRSVEQPLTPADLTLLPKVLDAAARAGARPSDAEMEALEEREGLENMFAGAIPI